ncbi:FxSxx-COOH system tetratricopeptide repeat protein [Streptomyces sp. LRE541]|uniref:FxSxx-COOH system tetratricopeptide repeat protein n=1 Tax=Streptomyces sp. LRE541 TaxID=2931983 RepID=UPI0020108EBF|nr:FxSxx-COOH system tetratricopeptide repeat protein [Streptomyces sp. LRE541]UPZ28979.1 FxSxx-COOH system tetratricopeptide repeat protein [Streptomyces sp. LRE541]
MNLDDHTLLIEPVVAWPREAETQCEYLVTVDLRGPLTEDGGAAGRWPYPDEEFTFTVTLDGSPYFVCAALDEPSVVLHRFGGTYGSVRFRVSTGRATGHASMWLTVNNQWGVPVRKAELLSKIRERVPGSAPAARLAEVMRERTSAVGRMPSPETPERSGDLPKAEYRPAGDRRPADRRSVPDPLPELVPPSRPRRLRTGRQTVTLSFSGVQRSWADWIGHLLERRGHRVVHQRWGPPPGVPIEDSLRDLLLAPGPVLLLLSDQFFRLGTRMAQEWDLALREVAVPNAQRIAAVTVAPSAPPIGAAALDAVTLHDVSAEEAERRLLNRLDLPSEPLPEPPEDTSSGPPFPVHTLRVWGRVPERNDRFTGRLPLLNTVYEALQRDSRVTLHGLSGVGKTQLAAEYAYRFSSGYHVVWWVHAGNRAAFRQGLADLAPELGLPTGTDYGERLRAVRDALGRGVPYPRWLLVLDGADEPDEIRDLVPTGTGHVLITSCNPDWGTRPGAMVEVSGYDREESVAFIRRRAPRLTEPDSHQLAEALGDLPLVLDQTAGWLEESGMPVAEYLEQLLAGDTDRDTLIQVSADFPMTFRAAWTFLLDKFRETSPDSVQLLRLCTFFAPDAVPVRLLRGTPADGLPPTVARLLTNDVSWDAAVGQLRKYSVVRVEHPPQDPSDEFLTVHRMVHRTVRHDMTPREYADCAEVARRVLVGSDPGNPDRTELWRRYAELVPHLEHADLLSRTDPDVQEFVLRCLRYLYVSGEYDTGTRFAEHALETWQGDQDEHSERLWDLGHHYANLLRAMGAYQDSEIVNRAAVEEHRATGGVREYRYLRAVGSLAADLRALGRYEESLQLSDEVCDGYADLRGEDHPATLGAQNNRAVSLRLLGRYEEALEIGRRVSGLRGQVLEADHFLTLYSALFCAIDLRLLGRYQEALEIQRENTRRHQEILGAEKPQTLWAVYNLAQCMYRMDELAEAGKYFATARAKSERVHGKRHSDTLVFATAHSCFMREHGDIDQARTLSERVVSRYERLLGPDHLFVVGARSNQALIHRAVGERTQARNLAEHALADMRSAVGPDHPWALGCAVNAAMTLHLTDRVEAAVELGRDTVERAGRIMGPDHPLTRVARRALEVDQRAYQGASHGQETADVVDRTRLYWNFEPLNV